MKYQCNLSTGFYWLDAVTIESDSNELQDIIELAAIQALKQEKGFIINVNDITQDEYNELEENDDRWLYLDLTERGYGCYFMDIESFHFQEVKE